jgi:hypothetical protein
MPTFIQTRNRYLSVMDKAIFHSEEQSVCRFPWAFIQVSKLSIFLELVCILIWLLTGYFYLKLSLFRGHTYAVLRNLVYDISWTSEIYMVASCWHFNVLNLGQYVCFRNKNGRVQSYRPVHLNCNKTIKIFSSQ